MLPAIWALPEMASVRDLYKRLAGGGCAKCRKRAVKPAVLAPSIGAALCRAAAAGRGPVLYKAVRGRYSIDGPVRFEIGPFKQTIAG